MEQKQESTNWESQNQVFPLLQKWKVWYNHSKKNQNSKENYSNILNYIAEFDCIETFWRVYNNLVPLDLLPSNTDFFIFKDYIKPQWEDPKNVKGGRWIYDIAWDKQKHNFISLYTETVWLNLILSLIGNHFDETEYFIAGIVMSIRHFNNKISIWVIGNDDDVIMKIGNLFKYNCDLDGKDKIYFQFHDKSPKEGNCSKYTL